MDPLKTKLNLAIVINGPQEELIKLKEHILSNENLNLIYQKNSFYHFNIKELIPK